MKKIVNLLFVMVAAVVLGVSTADAKTEQELRDHIANTGVTIGGVTKYLETVDINKVDEYLAHTELSSADCDYLYTMVDNIKALLESEGTTDSSQLSTAAKNQLKTYANNIAANTSVNLTISQTASGTTVTVIAGDNTTYPVELSNTDPFTNTGANTVLVSAAAIAIIGLGLGVRKFRKINA